MGPVSAKTTIDVPREQVFGLLSDLADRASFTDHFIDELRASANRVGGSRAALRFRDRPIAGFWMETVIAEIDAPHRLVERGRGGRLDRVPVSTVWELADGAAPAVAR